MMVKNYEYIHHAFMMCAYYFRIIIRSTANAPTFSFINKQDKVKQRDF